MKKLGIALAGLVALAACNKKEEVAANNTVDNAAVVADNAAGNLEAAADNAVEAANAGNAM